MTIHDEPMTPNESMQRALDDDRPVSVSSSTVVAAENLSVSLPPSPSLIVTLLCGLGLVTGMGWVLMLLGSAFGVTTLDAVEIEDGETLGTVAVLWIVVSWLIAYFIGAMLAVRLARATDRPVGMLHGIALWGFGVTVTLVLAFLGVSGVVEVGQSALQGTSTVAAATTLGGTLGDDGIASPTLRDARRELQVGLKNASRSALGPETTVALEELDAETLGSAAGELLAGRPEGAKQVLAIRTGMSEQEIDRIVNGLEAKSRELKLEVDAAAEKAVDYTEFVLWIAFLGASLALGAAICGGMLATDIVRRRFHMVHPVPAGSY